MSCEHIDSLLPPYVEGDLSHEESALVDAHVADCPACAESLAAYRLLESSLVERHSIRPPAAPFAGRVAARIGARPRRSVLRVLVSLPSLLSAAFVAAGVLLFFSGPAVLGFVARGGQLVLSRLSSLTSRIGSGPALHVPADDFVVYAVYLGVFALIFLSGTWTVLRFVRE